MKVLKPLVLSLSLVMLAACAQGMGTAPANPPNQQNTAQKPIVTPSAGGGGNGY
jgi:uncharacterized lipoprotein YajG